MNTNMILPAAIAAGIHAAVFAIRFDPVPPAPPPVIEVIEITNVPPLLPDFDDPPPVDRRETGEILPPPSDPAPRGLEHFTSSPLNPRDIVMVVPPVLPIVGTNTSIIPANPFGDEGTGNGPIPMAWLDNHPRVVFRTAPTPPREARDVVAEVTVEFIVDRDGRVSDVQVVHSSHGSFEEPCLRAVRRWRFEPGLKKNLPVAFRMRQTFVFNSHD